jgi:phytol kinase
MAFGDAAASIIGSKIGRHKLRFRTNKSYEGSIAMFLTTFISVTLSLMFFSYLCPFTTSTIVISSFAVAAFATLLEAFTPKGLDNLTVPLVSAILFLYLAGSI